MSLFDSPVRELLTVAVSVGASLFTAGRKAGHIEARLKTLEESQKLFATHADLTVVTQKLADVHADVREIRAALNALLLKNP